MTPSCLCVLQQACCVSLCHSPLHFVPLLIVMLQPRPLWPAFLQQMFPLAVTLHTAQKLWSGQNVSSPWSKCLTPASKSQVHYWPEPKMLPTCLNLSSIPQAGIQWRGHCLACGQYKFNPYHPCGSLSPPGVTPELRTRCKPWVPWGVIPKQNKETDPKNPPQKDQQPLSFQSFSLTPCIWFPHNGFSMFLVIVFWAPGFNSC